MEETGTIREARGAAGRASRFSWRTGLKVLGITTVALVTASAGAAIYLHSKFVGTTIPNSIPQILGTAQAFLEPRSFFPGRDRIVVLCLGLDRNIYRSRDPKLNGMPYTKGARSDVMMIASLDLASRSVSVLSVPRDTRVEIPGYRGHAKINDAHARGGVPKTIETVESFLEADLDHYVVIKQEAIQKIVDALGGVRLKVEKDMDYDDNWGQLHIHLKEGEQTLNGEQVVGYMRFRHDNEGDFGRIRRQQQVIQALADKVKSPSVLFKAPQLLDAIQKYIKTDFSKEQQVALAHLFHKVQPGSIQTAALPVEDATMIDGISYVIPDDRRKEAAVDWIIRGNKDAMNRLIQVELKNSSGDPELYQKVYRYLRACGFRVRRAGRASGDPVDSSHVVQRTNMRGAARRVLETLGLGGEVEKSEDRGADVTLYVGKDLETSQVLAMSELWPTPEAEEEEEDRPRVVRGSRRRRRSQEATLIRIRSVEPEATSSDLPPSTEESPASSTDSSTSSPPAEENPGAAPATTSDAPASDSGDSASTTVVTPSEAESAGEGEG